MYFDNFGEVLLFGCCEFQGTDWSECRVELALPDTKPENLRVKGNISKTIDR